MRFLDVILAGFDHVVDLVTLVNRHDGEPFVIVSRVQRDGEVDLPPLIREAPDLRSESHRGDGQPPRAELVAVRVVEPVNGRHGILVVVERFAHAHEDHVGHGFVIFPEHLRVIHHLRHDLAAGQVALESLLTGRTEDTSHCASSLGGDAQGAAILRAAPVRSGGGHLRVIRGVAVAHQHGLDQIPIRQLKQCLARGLIG